MRTPAIPRRRPRPPGLTGPRGPRRTASAHLVETSFRVHTLLVYLFLFLPIVVVVVFSFNANRRRSPSGTASTEWFEQVLSDRIIQGHLQNSFIVGFANAILATTFGTLAALGLQRIPHRLRILFLALTFVSIIVPEIVIALATLVFFATSFDFVNPHHRGPRLRLGIPTIVASHVLFNISLVLLLVRARLSTWTGRTSRPATTFSRRPGGHSPRSRYRSYSLRSLPGSSCRSRSASTTS